MTFDKNYETKKYVCKIITMKFKYSKYFYKINFL
jgi:hypothetical protein